MLKLPLHRFGGDGLRIEFLHGYYLSGDEASRRILREQQLGDRWLRRMLEGARWEFGADGRFRFLAAQRADDPEYRYGLEGVLCLGEEGGEFAGERQDGSIRVTLDGVVRAEGDELVLQALYTQTSSSRGSSPPVAAWITQRLSEQPPPSLGAAERRVLEGIPLPSAYRITVEGSCEGQRFAGLEGTLRLVPSEKGRPLPLSLTLLVGLGWEAGTLMWRPLTTVDDIQLARQGLPRAIEHFELGGGRVHMVVKAPLEDPDAIHWMTPPRPGPVPMSHYASLVQGMLSLRIDGPRIEGEIHASGSDAFTHQESDYVARFTGLELTGQGEAPDEHKERRQARAPRFPGQAPHGNISVPSDFTVTLSGSTEAGTFEAVPATLWIQAARPEDSRPFEVILLSAHSPLRHGALFWVSFDDFRKQAACTLQIEGDTVRLEHIPSDFLDSNRWTIAPARAADLESSADVFIQRGSLVFTVRGDEIHGEIHASGIYFPDDRRQESTYSARLTGHLKHDLLAEELRARATLMIDRFTGDYRSEDGPFGRFHLEESQAQVTGSYEGQGGGQIEGQIHQGRCEFTFIGHGGTAGRGWLRPLGQGEWVVGFYTERGSGGQVHSLSARRYELALHADAVTAPVDAEGLAQVGKDLLWEGKYRQAADLFEQALRLYEEERNPGAEEAPRKQREILAKHRDLLSLLTECHAALDEDAQMLERLEQIVRIERRLGPSHGLNNDLENSLAEVKQQLDGYREQVGMITDGFAAQCKRVTAAAPPPHVLPQRQAELTAAAAAQVEHHERLLERLTRMCDERDRLATALSSGSVALSQAFARWQAYLEEHTRALGRDVEEMPARQEALFTEHEELGSRLKALLDWFPLPADPFKMNLEEINACEAEFKRFLAEDQCVSPLERVLANVAYFLVPLLGNLHLTLDLQRQGVVRLAVDARLRADAHRAKRQFSFLANRIEGWRSRLVTDPAKIAALDKAQPFYRALIACVTELGFTEEALLLSEQARARAFLDLLAARAELPSSRVEPATLGPAPSPHVARVLAREDLTRIARLRSTTFVEYFLAGETLFIWVLRPTGELWFATSTLPAGTALGEAVGEARLALGVRGRSMLGEAPAPVSEIALTDAALAQLFDLLILPIASFLPTAPEAHITFIPHDVLFLVPFCALRDRRTQRYLIEDHTILVAPSIQSLELVAKEVALSPPSTLAAEVMVVGNPLLPEPSLTRGVELRSLPAAEAEAHAIARHFDTWAVIGAAATKEHLVPRMPAQRIIHLATHGLLDDLDAQGLPGGVVLTGGILTAREIMELRLAAELVVLSACHTGQGRLSGDGVLGLTRAFIAAGVTSIVGSLWAVDDDSTAKLMICFYQHPLRATDPAQALRQAMLSTRALAAYRHPRYWAAFTLYSRAETPPSTGLGGR